MSKKWEVIDGKDGDYFVGYPEGRGEGNNDYSLKYAEEHICFVFNQDKDNANLIAASPELEEACKALVEWADGNNSINLPVGLIKAVILARKAMAKVEGK